MLRIITALLAAAAVAACAGNGKGLDANGKPIGSGGGSTQLTADFQSIQDNIFTPICSKCHIGSSAPEGLQLDASHSYSLLVGVASTEQSGVKRVEPGDPDSSYIIRKLEGDPSISGVRMPYGGPYLPQATIDVIKQWIQAGAQKSAGSMSLEMAVRAVQRFSVASTAPDNGAIVSDAVPQIVVAFSADIDSNLLNQTTVALARIDSAAPSGAGTSTGTTGQPIPISTAVPVGNPSAIVITPRTPLTNGIYRVTLHGSLANMDAQALGQDFSFMFTVDTLP